MTSPTAPAPAPGARLTAPPILVTGAALLLALSAFGSSDAAGQAIPAQEYVERRARMMDEVPDGLLLLHARTPEKAMEQWGWIQDGSFQYLTGLSETPGAILVLDGPAREARLWVSPSQPSFGGALTGIGASTGPEVASRLGLASVEEWDGFVPWVRSRIGEEVRTLYVDGSRRPEATGAPPGMQAVSGERTLWRASLEEAFPSVPITSVREVMQRHRWAKSPAEATILYTNAQATVDAIKAVAEGLEPGMRQRATESLVVSACLAAGAQGPSFWPWTMSGPNGHSNRLFGAFYAYDNLDREALAGEVVRVDIGCAGGGYGADVGRTFPVSGQFTPGQAEAWNLVVAGYRAGLGAMRDGASFAEVRAASVAEVERLAPEMRTPHGRMAAEVLVARGASVWHIHGIGIESGEEGVDPFVAGAVVAYEPTVEVGPDAFYLEDMILITPTGHEVLSTGLPYTAQEIEAFMRGR